MSVPGRPQPILRPDDKRFFRGRTRAVRLPWPASEELGGTKRQARTTRPPHSGKPLGPKVSGGEQWEQQGAASYPTIVVCKRDGMERHVAKKVGERNRLVRSMV